MADKDLMQGQQLARTDKSRYVDVGDGVYAPLVATTSCGTPPTSAALTLTHSVVNVNGNTAVLAANTARRYLLIINDSDTTIYLRLQSGAAVVNSGIRLNPNGGSYELTLATELYTGAIRATHAGGAVDKVLLVTEGV